MAVGGGRRHADIVQQPQVEQLCDTACIGALGLGAFGRHDANPLAMGKIVDAYQIERIGKREDDVPQVGGEAASALTGCRGTTALNA
jgi:hypothetical protein